MKRYFGWKFVWRSFSVSNISSVCGQQDAGPSIWDFDQKDEAFNYVSGCGARRAFEKVRCKTCLDKFIVPDSKGHDFVDNLYAQDLQRGGLIEETELTNNINRQMQRVVRSYFASEEARTKFITKKNNKQELMAKTLEAMNIEHDVCDDCGVDIMEHVVKLVGYLANTTLSGWVLSVNKSLTHEKQDKRKKDVMIQGDTRKKRKEADSQSEDPSTQSSTQRSKRVRKSTTNFDAFDAQGT